jgi:Chs5-Arf1p-binding protein BUD7/BCH1
LVRLPAPGLRGTWARAYSLLTRIVSHIGWDELLKTRSAVFVMEEEYRMQKAATATSESVQTVLNTATTNGQQRSGADDNASTRALHSPKPVEALEPGGIPTIRISTDSEVEREHAEALKLRQQQEEEATAEGASEENDTATEESATLNGEHERAADSLEKPRQAAAGELEKENSDVPPQSPATQQENFSFSNKRLCERWLDNLFMVLYEVGGYVDFFIQLMHVVIILTSFLKGPPRMDNLPRRSGPFQKPTGCVP